MKKRTQITIVTRQTVIAKAMRVRCQQCGAEVSMVASGNAAGALQTTPSEIHGLLASGELDSVPEPSGANLICGNSLCAATDSEPSAIAGGESSIKGERQ